MEIVDLGHGDAVRLEETAALLQDGFRDTGSRDWRTRADAMRSVRESLHEDCISRVALDGSARVSGWVAGLRTYDGRVWELHPLVVRRDRRGQGVGRALVADFEAQVRRRGGLTIYLGADDEDCRTSLGGIDLYPEPLEKALRIRSLADHPFAFYQKLGFAVVGVLPDANGYGKPDIFMAKRVGTAADPAGRI